MYPIFAARIRQGPKKNQNRLPDSLHPEFDRTNQIMFTKANSSDNKYGNEPVRHKVRNWQRMIRGRKDWGLDEGLCSRWFVRAMQGPYELLPKLPPAALDSAITDTQERRQIPQALPLA
jgi:hypothetical protein